MAEVPVVQEVRTTMEAMGPEFSKVLPLHIKADKFVRVIMTAIQTNPDLLRADRRSLYAAAMRAAQSGLLPDGREASIVVYKMKNGEMRAQFMPQIAGLCKIARNSGEIKTLNAEVVFEKDHYESWTDETGEHFKFMKAKGERGNPVCTFAYAITKDGGLFFEEVSEEQMSAIEKMSRASSGPWTGAFRSEMKRKTALRRLLKYRVPSSTDLDDLVRSDDEMYDLKTPVLQQVKPERLITKMVEREPGDDIEDVPKTHPPHQSEGAA
jgi:recombination protein RecT